MISDEIREKIIDKMVEAAFGESYWYKLKRDFPHHSDSQRAIADRMLSAVLPMIVEKCAEVAEKMPQHILETWNRTGGSPISGYRCINAGDVATAIRSLAQP